MNTSQKETEFDRSEEQAARDARRRPEEIGDIECLRTLEFMRSQKPLLTEWAEEINQTSKEVFG